MIENTKGGDRCAKPNKERYLIMIITKFVQITVVRQSKEFWKEVLGFDVKVQQKYVVDVSLLPTSSKVKVLAKCDDCGIQRVNSFRDYRPKCASCSRKKDRHAYCIDCGIEITLDAKRCHACFSKIKLKNKCIDCGKKVGNKDVARCRECWLKKHSEDNFVQKCELCGKERFHRTYNKLCRECYEKQRNLLNPHCLECGELLENKQAVRHLDCWYEYIRGKRNPKYNSNITDDERIKKRNTFEYNEWQFSVKERDGFQCQVCGYKGNKLVSHHYYSYTAYPEIMYDKNNGICLCINCHRDFHGKYGYFRNTKEQFDEYLKNLIMN